MIPKGYKKESAWLIFKTNTGEFCNSNHKSCCQAMGHVRCKPVTLFKDAKANGGDVWSNFCNLVPVKQQLLERMYYIIHHCRVVCLC